MYCQNIIKKSKYFIVCIDIVNVWNKLCVGDYMEILNSIMCYLQEINDVTAAIRIVLAVVCGGIIGVERGRSNQAAGMRTYMLVCMGSAIAMMVGQFALYKFGTGDPSRIGAQVISGIGFLGAGTILVSENRKIKGLTTAAGLWASACIGISIGIGFYTCGFVATLLVIMINTRFRKIENHFNIKNTWVTVYVEIKDIKHLTDIYSALDDIGMKIEDVQTDKSKPDYKSAIISLRNLSKSSREHIINTIINTDGVMFARYIS